MMKRLTAILLVLVLLLSCIGIGEAASAKRLKKGSRGAAVKTLQTALKEQGYYSGKIDGIFGKGTVNAVKAFQRKNGLKVDGIAGPLTQEKLYSGSGTKTSSAESSAQSPATEPPPQETQPRSESAFPIEQLSFPNRSEINSGAD